MSYVGADKGIHGFRGENAESWQFGRPRLRWEGNIKTDCKDMM